MVTIKWTMGIDRPKSEDRWKAFGWRALETSMKRISEVFDPEENRFVLYAKTGEDPRDVITVPDYVEIYDILPGAAIVPIHYGALNKWTNRVDINDYELWLDNDVIIWNMPPSIAKWIGSKAILLSSDLEAGMAKHGYGIFQAEADQYPIPINSGVVGLPPGLDIAKELTRIYKSKTGENWSKHCTEQGGMSRMFYMITGYDKMIMSHEEVNLCSRKIVSKHGTHLWGLNRNNNNGNREVLNAVSCPHWGKDCPRCSVWEDVLWDGREDEFPQSAHYNEENRLSIIITVRDRKSTLVNCLRTLSDQTLVPEVIVVDYGGTDNIRSLVEDYGFKYIHVNVTGIFRKAHAINIGVKQATNEYIGNLDADMMMSPNFMEIVNGSLSPDTFLLCLWKGTISNKVSERLPFDMVWNSSIPPPHNLGIGGLQVAHRGVWHDLRGYDEEFYGWGVEDRDFLERAEKAFNLRRVFICHQGARFVHQTHDMKLGSSYRNQRLWSVKDSISREKLRLGIYERNVDGWGEMERMSKTVIRNVSSTRVEDFPVLDDEHHCICEETFEDTETYMSHLLECPSRSIRDSISYEIREDLKDRREKNDARSKLNFMFQGKSE